MSAQMDSLSSCLNPSLFYFAPISPSFCKPAESHLRRVSVLSTAGTRTLWGPLPLQPIRQGKTSRLWQGWQGGPGWLQPVASSLPAAGEVSELQAGHRAQGVVSQGAARARTLLGKLTPQEAEEAGREAVKDPAPLHRGSRGRRG